MRKVDVSARVPRTSAKERSKGFACQLDANGMRIVHTAGRLPWHVQGDTRSCSFGKRLRNIAISHSPNRQKAAAGFALAWNLILFEYRYSEAAVGELLGRDQPGGSSTNDDGIIEHIWHCSSPTARSA